MAARRNVGYDALPADDDNDFGRRDRRFEYKPGAYDRIPWKSIALALFLLSLGSLLLFLSFFILTGHMGGEKSQGYGLLFLGFLAFMPGFYETRIAYYSWRGTKGYRFASIPNY
ncbi:uncharacterized protein LOC126679081 [Mercurialis annua]|uniref:uncharacterized protein LOC126679081 n=1 Tax=Mercurialis annua TaxID=3986 RepID=UPI00215ECC85|nr:uncharacterized protein LOC126679081 [Mercurialis annua]XP_050229976.1 uncharacterized protein LOC126679081 [Mercurialis annua]